MPRDKLRRQIAWEAARLVHERHETLLFKAKIRAARRLTGGVFRSDDLPSTREIRDELEVLSRTHGPPGSLTELRDRRLEALRVMQLLRRFRPRLLGETLTGHVQPGRLIELHVFADAVADLVEVLATEGVTAEVRHRPIDRSTRDCVLSHVRFETRYPFVAAVMPRRLSRRALRKARTGRRVPRANANQLIQLLELEASEAAQHAERETPFPVPIVGRHRDRFQIYESLLEPLERVKQSRTRHPEGDALYHSLQVFELARDVLPYDEEFLLAALLHDVGKGIDSANHVAAGLEALNGSITERTAWLIEHHGDAQSLYDGTLGIRSRRRLEASEHFEELVLLARCDRRGRTPGAPAPDLPTALDYIRELSEMCGD